MSRYCIHTRMLIIESSKKLGAIVPLKMFHVIHNYVLPQTISTHAMKYQPDISLDDA